MTTENERTINLFEELGVSDERAHEINMEINAIRDNSELLTDILSSIPKAYDQESIILGVFLCEMILENDGRLLPLSMDRSIFVTIPDVAKKILDGILKDIETSLGDPKISPKGD